MRVPEGVKHFCMISGHRSLAWSTRNGSFEFQHVDRDIDAGRLLSSNPCRRLRHALPAVAARKRSPRRARFLSAEQLSPPPGPAPHSSQAQATSWSYPGTTSPSPSQGMTPVARTFPGGNEQFGQQVQAGAGYELPPAVERFHQVPPGEGFQRLVHRGPGQPGHRDQVEAALRTIGMLECLVHERGRVPEFPEHRPQRVQLPRSPRDVVGRGKWFWLTLREAEAAASRGRNAGRLSVVVLSGLWLVSAVAGFCFRICRR